MGEGSPSNGDQSTWRPRELAFRSYLLCNETRGLRVVVVKPLVSRLTKDIVKTYQICNQQFKYSEELNPKRYLTSPSVGVLNDGYDNVNSDLILAVNFVLINLETQRRYVVKDVLGHGTFGQVAKCWDAETNSFVAVKIIKNQPAYYQQALVEVSILTTVPNSALAVYSLLAVIISSEIFACSAVWFLQLNKKYDPDDKHHIVRIYDYFLHQRHLCICFELLDTNLYELIKINHFRGLSLSIVQLFSKQILRGLALLKDAGIIHCDLKPENILLCTSVKPAEIKIIDFGSACMEDRTVYSYIQSRYYRSPEVLLGHQYTTAIDMWSFGCIVAELFLGLPLFPGASEFDLLRRMIEILGAQPPDYVLKEAKNTSKFFKCIGNVHHMETSELFMGGRSAYQALTEMEYGAPVGQNIKVAHHPGAGHWFAAGLSPKISGRNKFSLHNSSHYQVLPYAHGNSYGSAGSYGSYNDGTGLGSSYGSYGDGINMLTYFSPIGPSGMNMAAQGGMSMHGSSPDARKRVIQYSHGNGLGVSPSAGIMVPLLLGTSPSQFTPSSYCQVSTGSPGHYGPTSPARSSVHGSPLGKMAAVTHYNRKKSWGYSGNSQESSSSQHWQGQYIDGNSFGQSEVNSQVLGGFSPHLQSNPGSSNSKQQQGGSGITHNLSAMKSMSCSLTHGSSSAETDHDKPEASLSVPDPGDWDPNYSDELLLQEDGPNETSLAAELSNAMLLGSADSSVGIGRFNHTSTGSNLPFQRILGGRLFLSPFLTLFAVHFMHFRQNGPIQAFSHEEMTGPLSSYYQQAGYSHFMSKSSHFMTHSSQNSPSRLGQCPVQRNNCMRPNAPQASEWNHIKVPPPASSFNSGGQRSPGSGSFNSLMPWGRRGNHPVTNILPAFRGRKDYGRIV